MGLSGPLTVSPLRLPDDEPFRSSLRCFSVVRPYSLAPRCNGLVKKDRFVKPCFALRPRGLCGMRGCHARCCRSPRSDRCSAQAVQGDGFGAGRTAAACLTPCQVLTSSSDPGAGCLFCAMLAVGCGVALWGAQISGSRSAGLVFPAVSVVGSSSAMSTWVVGEWMTVCAGVSDAPNSHLPIQVL